MTPDALVAADLTRFFHPVLEARALGRKEPARVTLGGHSYALFRDHTGRAAALRDRCPHRFAPLSAGTVRPDGRLACPYHGWNFDAEGRGASPTQPSLTRCDVESFRVVERYGFLWLAKRETPEERMPALHDPATDHYVGTLAMRFEAPLFVCLDNFSEDEHTPWVHTRLGWDARDVGTVSYEAHNHEDRTEVRYEAKQRHSALLFAAGIRSGDLFRNEWATRFDPVRTDFLLSWADASTGALRPLALRAQIFMVPETARTTLFHIALFARVHDPAWRPLVGVLGPVARALVWKEIDDDRRFIPVVADTPERMKGMRLGRFDKPLVHNRRLLDRLYWGRDERESEVSEEGAVTPSR